MRSQYVDQFNHDEDAADYDTEVRDGSDPIRAAYAEALAWVARRVRPGSGCTVLELGSGTGNLTQRLLAAGVAPERLICVDVSKRMTAIARSKLGPCADAIQWLAVDLLEYFDRPGPPLDVIASSYTLHHLTEEEKAALLAAAARRLAPGGRLVVADLAFESAAARAAAIGQWRSAGQRELVQAATEEFFWLLDSACERLQRLDMDTTVVRFSELSWGLLASSPLSARGRATTARRRGRHGARP